MEENEQTWWQKHKTKVYVGVGAITCVGIGIVIGRKSEAIVHSAKTIQINVGWKNTNVAMADLSRRGHPGLLIKFLGAGPWKGHTFKSKNDMAEKMDITRAAVTKMIENGEAEIVGDAH